MLPRPSSIGRSTAVRTFNRMLKKSASGVLASLRGSTYRTEYASPLYSLRPCWTAILSILVTLMRDLAIDRCCAMMPR
jgi:hypothetical protein